MFFERRVPAIDCCAALEGISRSNNAKGAPAPLVLGPRGESRFSERKRSSNFDACSTSWKREKEKRRSDQS